MKINELSGLYVVENKTENFTILVVALDEQEAIEIAREYFNDSHMDYSNLEVYAFKYAFKNIFTNFDCDYVVTKGQ